MPSPVNLYDSAYANYQDDVYLQIRVATYGEDLGQTSWVTTGESYQIPRDLELTADSSVLEIGCGSGRYALHIAELVGCQVLGVDINQPAIAIASQLASARNMSDRARFEYCDLSQALAFRNSSFDAVFANDVLCHVPGRAALLKELFRVLRKKGRLLFSDALVVGGLITNDEIAIRSSIGRYVFAPPGENERLLQGAGFEVLSVRDTTTQAGSIARLWYTARQEREDQLIACEGKVNYEGVQRFLHGVYQLTSEKRLLRYLYLARKN